MTNFILGKGMLHLDGRYVGETSKVDIVRKLYGFELHVALSDISDANLCLLTHSRREVFAANFEAHNPVGENVDFNFPAVQIIGGELPLKDPEWMLIGLRMRLKAGKDGNYFTWQRRPNGVVA